MKLESLALHHGYQSEPTTKAAAVPIYQTTSYTFDNTQHGADLFDLKVEGNIYTRIMNPTSAVLERRIAEMEGGVGAVAVASGMAAITYAIQCITSAGENIVSTSQLYGGTYNLFAHTFEQITIRSQIGSSKKNFKSLKQVGIGRLLVTPEEERLRWCMPLDTIASSYTQTEKRTVC